MSQPSSAPDDYPRPDMPRHLILFVGALVAIGALSLDMYLPAMPAMANAFGVGIVRMNDTISLYLVGYGLGQFFGGAFSDQIGRKRVGLVGLSIFVLASLAIAFSTTVEQVQALRFVQAIGGGFSTVICMAIVRDVYPVEELGKRMASVMLVMLASPLIAPTLGAALLRYGGWHSIFIFKAVYAAGLAAFYFVAVPETHRGEWRNLSVLTTLHQCVRVVTHKDEGGRRPIMFALTMALGAGAFMTFLTNSSFAYIEYFGVAQTYFPLYFGVSVLGLVATNLFSMRRLTPANAPTFFRLGLIVQLAAVITLVTAVLEGPRSIWLVVAPMTVIVACLGLVGPAGSSQFMRSFGRLAGSASSLYTTLLFSMGAVFGSISGVFFDGTLRPMVLTMLAASVCANALAFLTGATLRRPKVERNLARAADRA